MAKYTIKHERERCIGCGACAAVCAENWEMADDGKSKPKKTELSQEQYECNKEAAEACPVHCILILDEKGKQIVPEN